MSPPSLNEDVLALIVKEVARQAEGPAGSHSPVSIQAHQQWRSRASALARLSLVSSVLRPLAQAELSRYVWISRWNQQQLHAARLKLRHTRRIVLSQGTMDDTSRTAGVLEQCKKLEQLVATGRTFSLCSIARPSHQALRKLHLDTVEILGATPQTTPHFHLTSLELHALSSLGADDWRVLGVAGAGTLRHVKLIQIDIHHTAVEEASRALASWIPSLVSLNTRDLIHQVGLKDIIISLLPSATRLKILAIPLNYVARALPALPTIHGSTGLDALGVLAPCDGANPSISERYLALLNVIGRYPIENLKTFAYPKAHQEEDSVPLYEVVSALSMRGVEVIHGSLPPSEET